MSRHDTRLIPAVDTIRGRDGARQAGLGASIVQRNGFLARIDRHERAIEAPIKSTARQAWRAQSKSRSRLHAALNES